MSYYLGDYTAEFKRGKDKRPRKRRTAVRAAIAGAALLGAAGAAKYRVRGAGKIITGPGVLVSKQAAATARRGRAVSTSGLKAMKGSPGQLALNPGMAMKAMPTSPTIAIGQSASAASNMAYKAGAAARQAMTTTVRAGRTARQTVDATVDGYRTGSASPGAKSAARKLGGLAGKARRKIRKATGFSGSRTTTNFTRRWS